MTPARVALLLAAIALPAMALAQERAPAPAEVPRQSVYLTMPDGIRLAADIYLPPDLTPGARVPTIVMLTRYWRSYQRADGSCLQREDGRFFARNGYALVFVDVRGSGASFGHRTSERSREEIADGRAVLDWIVAQPWSNGRVGATGVSYVGATAEMLATLRHPALRAISPNFSAWDSHAETYNPGGIQHPTFARDWGTMIAAMDRGQPTGNRIGAYVGPCPVDGDRAGTLLRQAIAEHRRNIDAERDLLMAIRYRDDRSTTGRSHADGAPGAHAPTLRAARLPTYTIAGWWDGAFTQGALRRLRTLGDRGDNRIIIGPWNHGGGWQTRPGTVPARSTLDLNGERLRFFDRYLKAEPAAMPARIRLYVMGANRWLEVDRWPATQARRWCLSARRRLDERCAGAAGSDRLTVDPATDSGTTTRWETLVTGAAVHYPDRARQGAALLAYQSAPLATAATILGEGRVDLLVAADRPSADVHLYLEEVTARGEVRMITEGRLRIENRRIAERGGVAGAPYHSLLRRDARPIAPGEAVRASIALLPTAYRVPAGSRLRLAIAGADNHFARLPDSATELTFFHRRGGGAAIHLPMLPER